MRIINEAGLNLIKSYEGCRLVSYPDVGGIFTIGFGHTGPEVVEGLRWTQDQADNALLQDLAIAEAEVQTHVHTDLSSNQFSALVSLVFNCGRGVLEGHIGKYLNLGNYASAADFFLRWDQVKGQVVPGLYDRRCAERALFLRPDSG